MRGVGKPSRAYGSNGGASTGGYEITDPDYSEKRLVRLKREFEALAPEWRGCFLNGLSRYEQKFVEGKTETW